MQIVKEEVVAIRGGWAVKARIVVYHSNQRRAEIYLERIPNVPFQEVGWTLEEIAELHKLLANWRQKVGDV